MDCTEFNLVVVDLCRERGVNARLRREALEHAGCCEGCSARLESERSLAAALRLWGEADLAEAAPDRAEANLQTAFAMTHSRRAVGWGRLLWAAGVAAAMVLAVLGARFLVLNRPMVPRSRQTNQAVPSQPKPARTKTPELAKRQKPPASMRIKNRVSSRAESASSAGVLAPDFLRLPGADGDVPIGDGTVVRVEMSGSELVRAGVPLEASYSAQPIVADVLLDQNGTARAIRVVSAPDAQPR